MATKLKIKGKPAKDSPWGKFFLKTIELDEAYQVPKGSHWYWAFYMLKKQDKIIKFETGSISDILPDNHVQKNKIISLHSYLMTPIEDLIKDLGSPQKIKKINFSNLVFDNESFDFSNFIFPIEALFSKAKFSKRANFTNAIFCKEVKFIYAKFLNDADFNHAIFSVESSYSNADFSYATFSDSTSFRKSIFHGSAIFRGTIFSSYVIFIKAQFFFFAVFSSAKFSEHADFRDTTFFYPVRLTEATFSSMALFDNAKFTIGAVFNGVVFSDSANFTNVTFNSTGDFINATFSGLAQFNRATLESANFSYAKFEKLVPHFYDAKISANIIWDKNPKLWPQIDWSNIYDHYKALMSDNQNAYENLVSHMKKLDKYHDEHFFYREEMRCRRWLERNPCISFSYWLYEKLADNGYGIGRALFWWSFHILLGAVFIFDRAKTACNTNCDLIDNFYFDVVVSFANAHGVLLFSRGPLKEYYTDLKMLNGFNTIWGIQTVLGILLLFLLLLTLRIRFRLK